MTTNLEVFENTPIKMLAKYLVTKGVQSGSRLQRLLFICRGSEIVHQQTANSVFAPNNNFQAGINGPVNVETYYYLRPMFIEIDEKDHYLLSKEQMAPLEAQYGAIFAQGNVCSDDDLRRIIKTNQAGKQARQGIRRNQICTNLIDEQSVPFLQMDDKAILQAAQDYYVQGIREFAVCCNEALD